MEQEQKGEIFSGMYTYKHHLQRHIDIKHSNSDAELFVSSIVFIHCGTLSFVSNIQSFRIILQPYL